MKTLIIDNHTYNKDHRLSDWHFLLNDILEQGDDDGVTAHIDFGKYNPFTRNEYGKIIAAPIHNHKINYRAIITIEKIPV